MKKFMFFRILCLLSLNLGIIQAQEYESIDDEMNISTEEEETIIHSGVSRPTQSPLPSQSSSIAENRLSTLEAQLRELRGMVEELQHQQKNFSSPTVVTSEESLKSSSPLPLARSKQEEETEEEETDADSAFKTRPALKQYEEAQRFLTQQAYPEAERALKDILTNYPQDRLVVNAHYWLGEIYYIQKQYTKAAVAFGDTYKSYRLLDKASDKNQKTARKLGFVKAPEALVKLALSLKALGKKEQACVTLDQLRSEFPQLPQNVKKLAEIAEQDLFCKKGDKQED